MLHLLLPIVPNVRTPLLHSLRNLIRSSHLKYVRFLKQQLQLNLSYSTTLYSFNHNYTHHVKCYLLNNPLFHWIGLLLSDLCGSQCHQWVSFHGLSIVTDSCSAWKHTALYFFCGTDSDWEVLFITFFSYIRKSILCLDMASLLHYLPWFMNELWQLSP